MKGLRDDPVKAAALQEHDEHGLLADVPLLDDMETPGDILDHDPLGLLGGASVRDVSLRKPYRL